MSKLSRIIQNDFGYVNIHIHSASLAFIPPPGNAWVDISLSNPNHSSAISYYAEQDNLTLKRRTSDIRISNPTSPSISIPPLQYEESARREEEEGETLPELQFNEAFEMRCKIGWELEIKLTLLTVPMIVTTINDSSKSENKNEKEKKRGTGHTLDYLTLYTHPFTLSDSCIGPHHLYLRQRATAIESDSAFLHTNTNHGYIFISIDFYPNILNYNVLCRDALTYCSGGSSSSSSSSADSSSNSNSNNCLFSIILDQIIEKLSVLEQHRSGNQLEQSDTQKIRDEKIQVIIDQLYSLCHEIQSSMTITQWPDTLKYWMENTSIIPLSIIRSFNSDTTPIEVVNMSQAIHILQNVIVYYFKNIPNELMTQERAITTDINQEELQKEIHLHEYIPYQQNMSIIEQFINIFQHNTILHSQPHMKLQQSCVYTGSNTKLNLHAFVLSSLMWYVQTCYNNISMCYIPGTQTQTIETRKYIDIMELTAIRTRYYIYDINLCGDIHVSDLSYLLLDMGLQYDADEIGIILAILDPDQVGIIQFNYFINWWIGNNINTTCMEMDVQIDML
jgi:hypothetical protein